MAAYGRRTSQTGERQRKIAEVGDLLRQRGYILTDLSSSAKGWAVDVDSRKRVPGVPQLYRYSLYHFLERPSYEELVRTIADDLEWALLIHRQRGRGNDEALRQAENQRYFALDKYASCLRKAALARFDGNTEQAAQWEAQATEAHERAKAMHDAYIQARQVYQDYVATEPATHDEARAYLTQLTTEAQAAQ